MKSQLLLICLSFGITLSAQAGRLDPISFLQGCWGMTNESGSKVTEDWFKRSDDTMLGVSQTVSQWNVTVAHEFLTINWEDSYRRIVYTPIIDNHAMKPFYFDQIQSGSNADKAVFLNSKVGDFPEKITYSRNGNEKLAVALSGAGEDGKPFVIEYEMNRENCNSRF